MNALLRLYRRLLARLGESLHRPDATPPSVLTLRIFMVRTGEYEASDWPSSGWPLKDIGRSQAEDAARTIRQRLGDDLSGLAVLTTNFADLSYQQTAGIIAEHLGITMTPIQRRMTPPSVYELEDFAELGSALAMVVNGTSLANYLSDYGGNVEDVTLLGPPHGSVHELVITYVPGNNGYPPHELSRQFAA